MLGKEKKRTTFRELLKIRNEVTMFIGLEFFFFKLMHIFISRTPVILKQTLIPNIFFLYCSVDKQVFIHQLVQVQSPGIGNDDRLWLNLRSIFLRLLIYQESKISFFFLSYTNFSIIQYYDWYYVIIKNIPLFISFIKLKQL